MFQGILDITHSQHTQTDYGRLKEEHADNGGARINDEIMDGVVAWRWDYSCQ